jgi:phosphatidate cytidylyltransferase
MPSYAPGEGFLVRAILSGWVAVYFGICFSFAIALRLLGDNVWGLYVLVGVIVITKFADSGAYFTGRALGRTKLCPAVSPGKTVEGLLGGMVVASAAGWVYFSWAAPAVFGDEVTVHFAGVFALGVGLTIAGVFGDLVESIVKRETGCKDSGRVLPGLGGFWDVTDSLLPAMVVAYLIILLDWIKGPGM